MSDGANFSISGIGQNPKSAGSSAAAHIASNYEVPVPKKNPLSNENLPGGIFTHPNALS